jgi:hypothetical protein
VSLPRPRASAAAAGALLALATSCAVASAHDVFTSGPYRIAIGWQFEPSSGTDTYVGEQNAIQVFVDTASATDQRGTPVSALNADCAHPDFQVTVTVGSITSSPFCPEPVYDPDTGSGRLDEYDHPLIPTVVGIYTFHILGAINGTPVDQTVTSGPSTFDSVADSTASQFPIAVPSVTEIAGKVDAVNRRAATATTAAADANARASGAVTMSIVAIVVAVLLSAANLVIALRRRAT